MERTFVLYRDIKEESKMKAAVYKADGRIVLEERQVPVIQDPRDAVIKVTLTTICSSDIHIKHGADAGDK